jgi:hypothetical protein
LKRPGGPAYAASARRFVAATARQASAEAAGGKGDRPNRREGGLECMPRLQ